MKSFSILSAAIVMGFSGTTAALAAGKAPQQKADNTAVNEHRQQAALPSADNAGQSDAEIKLAASIRQAIVGRDDLSTYAKNIKIIVNGDTVRLAGPVRNSDEKAVVERIAKANARSSKVTSEVYVAK